MEFRFMVNEITHNNVNGRKALKSKIQGWLSNFVVQKINILDRNLQTIAEVYFEASVDSIRRNNPYYSPCTIAYDNALLSKNNYLSVPMIITNLYSDSKYYWSKLFEYLKSKDNINNPVITYTNKEIKFDKTLPLLSDNDKNKGNAKFPKVLVTMNVLHLNMKNNLSDTLITHYKENLTSELFMLQIKEYLVDNTVFQFPDKAEKTRYGTYPKLCILSGRYLIKKRNTTKEQKILDIIDNKFKTLATPKFVKEYHPIKMEKIYVKEAMFNNCLLVNNFDKNLLSKQLLQLAPKNDKYNIISYTIVLDRQMTNTTSY